MITKEKILEILTQNSINEGVVQKIAALIEPQFDKLNKRIAFQVKASDTLLLQVREMEKEINNYQKLIEAKDELINIIDNKDVIVPERYKQIREKRENEIAELRKEVEK